MSEQPTPSMAFCYGADAMRARVVAMLMVDGQILLAQKVMRLDMPRVQWPEALSIGTPEPPNE